MPESQCLNLELDVLDLEHGSLRFGGVDAAKRVGHPALTQELVQRLSNEALDDRDYGIALFEALLPERDVLRVGYRKAVEEAQRTKSRLRFKLGLSLDLPEQLHGLCWERLFDPEQEAAIARHPQTAFSRSVLTGGYAAEPAAVKPRLLVAVAAPSDIEQHDMVYIDREEIEQQLAENLKPLRGVIDYEFLKPPVSASRLRSCLRNSHFSFHALHLIAHGFITPKISSGILVLEKNDGRCDFLTEKDLPQIFWGAPDLRLLTLMTCQGATQSSEDPLSGLGRRLVRAKGLPAVISMQDTVTFATAEEFSSSFYQELGKHGVVDAAVNEARHQLFLIDRSKSRWSDPLLFMCLQDGALWIPDASRKEEVKTLPGEAKPGHEKDDTVQEPSPVSKANRSSKTRTQSDLHQGDKISGDAIGTRAGKIGKIIVEKRST